jgi:putative ABC transport system permease protein
MGLLRSVLPSEIPIPDAAANALLPTIEIDTRALLFTLIVSLSSSVFFGGIPAIVFSRQNVSESMKSGSRGSASGHQRIRGVLVVSEVTLSLILLAGAGLMIHSFWRLGQVNPGFHPDHLLTLEMELPTDSKYRQGPEQAAVFERILESAKNVPGVKSAALTQIVPLTQREDSTQFMVDGSASITTDVRIPAQFRSVSARYFATMGIPILKGREFTDNDKRDAPSVVLIDQSLANLYWPHDNPIGQHVRFSPTGRLREIVGVVGSVKQSGLDQQDSPMIYAPFTQTPQQLMSLVVRTEVQPERLANDLKAAIWSVDKDQPVYNIRTMDAIVSETKATPKLSLALMSVFAGLALLLAAIGIYGVVSYSVAQSTHEIGIRMALGARTADVLKLMLGNGMVLTVIGVVIGLIASVGLGRIMSTILYGIKGTDFVTLTSVSLLLIVVALVASYIPARRATRVDPMIALRAE